MENNNLDKTYGFNNSKEKIEVYTKGDFAVITTQIVLKANETYAFSEVNLPDGFTCKNSIIIGAIYNNTPDFYGASVLGSIVSETSTGNGYNSELSISLGNLLSVNPNAEKVLYLEFNSSTGSLDFNQMYYVKIVLLKTSNIIEDIRPIKVGDNLVGGSDNLIYFDMLPISNDKAENNRVIITGTSGTIFERVNNQQVQIVINSDDYEEVIGGKGGSGLTVCGTAITYGIGVVTSVNTESPYYQYIRIKETND